AAAASRRPLRPSCSASATRAASWGSGAAVAFMQAGSLVGSAAAVVAELGLAGLGGDAPGQALAAGVEVGVDDPGHRAGDALAGRDVQELVRAVCVGVRAEHAGDHELRAREL